MTEPRILTPKRWSVTLLGFLVLLLAVAAFAFFFGLPRVDVIEVLFRSGGGRNDRSILLDIRLPRIVAGALVGGSLGACGVILQALLRNPLAYPHILGISGGAAVGGVLAQIVGFSTVTVAGIVLPGGTAAAFAVALATAFLVYRIARLHGRMEPVTLILVGVVFNSLAGAVILLLFALSGRDQGREIIFWMLGSLERDIVNLPLFFWVCGIAAAGNLFLMRITRALNALTLGGDVAGSLGVPVERIRFQAFLGTSIVVAGVVSYCGMIGFVGLIVPHLLRLLLGPDHRLLFPAAFLGGGTFLVAADFLSRTVVPSCQIPVGVVTAFCGGPFFLFLLRKHRTRTLYHG